MSPLLLVLYLSTPTPAAEMILSPGGLPIDSFDGDEQVLWTDWGWECSAQVLDPPKKAKTPVTVSAVRIGLGSSSKRFDREAVSVAVGLLRLADGAAPTKLPGVNEWDWPETWFNIAISSDHLSEIPMDNLLPPTWSLNLDGGRLAVFVCGVDPEDGLPWPIDEESGDAAGLIIDPDLPGDGSYLWVHPMMLSLSDLGIEGGYVIEAVADDQRADVSGLSLTSIDPTWTYEGTVAQVTVQGQGFAEGMALTIGGLDVADVVIVDEQTATGRSPSGLPVGSHDVRAVSTDGEESLLTTAFQVTAADEGADGGTDGGTDGGSLDGGSVDGGSIDGEVDSEGSEGCGDCSQAGRTGSGQLLASLGGILGLVALRRTRRRRGHG